MANDSLNDFELSNNPSYVNQSTPRIFVICLAAYHNGLIHGAWINAAQELYKIQKEIKKMLLSSPMPNAEEFDIQSTEGFGSLKLIGQSLKSIQKMAAFIAAIGELGIELLHYYGDADSAQDAWENHYHGAYESELEFTIEWFDRLYMAAIPNDAQAYIDYASFRRHIFIEEFFCLVVGDICHIFSSP